MMKCSSGLNDYKEPGRALLPGVGHGSFAGVKMNLLSWYNGCLTYKDTLGWILSTT